MSTVKDSIPRTTLTIGQQRRLGALQAAKHLMLGTYGALRDEQVHQVIRLAEFIVDDR